MRNRFSLLVWVTLLALVPAVAEAQRQQSRLRIGIGIGRLVPLEPLASAENVPTEYRLDDAGAAIIAFDYWFRQWIGGRLSYLWVRPELAEPEGPSFVRLQSGYLAVLIAPVSIARVARPYAILGAALRDYNVNAYVIDGNEVWDIAPSQNRISGFAGTGITLHLGRFTIAPEAGVFLNSFKHEFPCLGCPDQRNRQVDLLLTLQLVFG